MKKHSIAFALISAIISSGAIVSSAQSQSVFLSNGTDSTVLFEGTASAPFQAEIWLMTSATKVANPCGLAIFSTLNAPNQFLIPTGGAYTDYASLPVQTIPVCSAGVLTEPRTANFKTAEGRTVLVGQTGSITAQYLGLRKRSSTFNACGFKTVSIKNSLTLGGDSIAINFAGQTNSMGDLTSITSLPICKKVGSSFIKYVKVP